MIRTYNSNPKSSTLLLEKPGYFQTTEGQFYCTPDRTKSTNQGPLRNLMIVWANEHQYLSNFQVTVLSKGIFLVFDQDSEDFKQVEKTIAKKSKKS